MSATPKSGSKSANSSTTMQPTTTRRKSRSYHSNGSFSSMEGRGLQFVLSARNGQKASPNIWRRLGRSIAQKSEERYGGSVRFSEPAHIPRAISSCGRHYRLQRDLENLLANAFALDIAGVYRAREVNLTRGTRHSPALFQRSSRTYR